MTVEGIKWAHQRMSKTILAFVFLFQFLVVGTLFLISFEIRELDQPRIRNSMFDIQVNPMVKNVNYTRHVKVLIIVLTAQSRAKRRMGIRQTWWQACLSNDKVLCYFATDNIEDADPQTRSMLEHEKETYDDMLFLPTRQGMYFGHRVLHLMKTGLAISNPDFLMRIDDDVFLCVDHLMHDIERFPTSFFHWGWMHCMGHELVYIDEGITMFSKDIVKLFLSQDPNQMLCHPFGDQTYTIWIQSLNLNRHSLYHIDTRIHHTPPASHVPHLKNSTDVCQRYIALHGVYDADYLLFWKNRGETIYSKSHVLLHPRDVCPFPPDMNWMRFYGKFRRQPLPCADKIAWSKPGVIFGGRQGG